MTKGWYGNRQQHALASKGVRSRNNMFSKGEINTLEISEMVLGREDIILLVSRIQGSLVTQLQFFVGNDIYNDQSVMVDVTYIDGQSERIILATAGNIEDNTSIYESLKRYFEMYTDYGVEVY